MSKIWEFILSIYNTPIVEMTGWRICLLIGFSVLAFLLLKKILKYMLITLKMIGTWFSYVFSPKKRCQRKQCPTCGRTLDKCICTRNQKRGYMSRLHHYKRGN